MEDHILKLNSLFLLCTLFLFSINTSAAVERDLGYENEFVFFELGLQAGYDSNLYNSPSNVLSSYYYQPDFKLGMNSGRSALGIQAVYEFDLFVPEGQEDIAQSNIMNIDSYWSPSIRNSFLLSVLHELSEEERGSGLTDDNPFSIGELDSYEFERIKFGYNFANPRQKSLLFNLAYGESSKAYDSTRSAALSANTEQTSLETTLGYQWNDNKKLFLGLNNIDQLYPDVPNQSQDATNQISFIGLDWELTSAFDVFITVGEENKKFDVGNESLNTDYWDVVVTWSPLSYTRLSFKSTNEQRPLTEANQTLNELNKLSVSWDHSWVDDYMTTIQLSQEETNSVASNVVDLEEELLLTISVYYRDFEFTISFEDENSNSQDFSQFSVLFAFTLEGGF